MQEKNSFSAAVPILISAFFVLTPIAVLLAISREHPRVPAEDYTRAVRETMRPDSARVLHSLVSVDLNQPVTVVSWMRRNQAQDYKGKTTPEYKNTWVTVAPRLKSFCQDYVKAQGADPEKLTLRLEQRLGLPPGAHYDSFVELKVDHPEDITKFFRPCKNPSPSGSNTCDPIFPPMEEPEEIKDKIKSLDLRSNSEADKYWLLSKYFRSFASSHPHTWTSLGYTFDWAPKEDGSEDFVRWGESEFVISPGAPIQFVSATDTVAYCTPQ